MGSTNPRSKTSFGQNFPANPAVALVNSPYFSKYSAAFDLIYYNGQQPKYKIDWLLQSLDMGRELEDGGDYVVKSMNENLPYFCETEYEFSCFFNEAEPLSRGFIDGILDMCFLYSKDNKDYAHPAKQKYWQDQLLRRAESGDLEARGALCSDFAQSGFSVDEVNAFREKYQSSLLQQAELGKPMAQLAVGKYLSPYQSPEQFSWLEKAGTQGAGDAWYYLGNLYYERVTGTYRPGNGDGSVPPAGIQKNQEFAGKDVECYLKAAEAGNGVTAGYCQYCVATYYEYGDYFLPKDGQKAEYWYRKAANNGIKDAMLMFDSLPTDGEPDPEGIKKKGCTKHYYRAITIPLLFFIVILLFFGCFRLTDDDWDGPSTETLSVFAVDELVDACYDVCQISIPYDGVTFLAWAIIIVFLGTIAFSLINALMSPSKNASVNPVGFIGAVIFSIIILSFVSFVQNRLTYELLGWVDGSYLFNTTAVPWLILLSGMAGAFLCFYASYKEKHGQSEGQKPFSKFAEGVSARVSAQKSSQSNLSNAANDLKIFKDLLDSGVITQEEFDEKKKQLLGL